jgi:hypothetical protein
MLFGPTYRQFELNTEEGRSRLLDFENQPIWSVEGILKLWDRLGGAWFQLSTRARTGSPVRPTT